MEIFLIRMGTHIIFWTEEGALLIRFLCVIFAVVWKNLHSLEGRDHRNWGRQEGICSPLSHLQALVGGSSMDLDRLAAVRFQFVSPTES